MPNALQFASVVRGVGGSEGPQIGCFYLHYWLSVLGVVAGWIYLREYWFNLVAGWYGWMLIHCGETSKDLWVVGRLVVLSLQKYHCGVAAEATDLMELLIYIVVGYGKSCMIL